MRNYLFGQLLETYNCNFLALKIVACGSCFVACSSGAVFRTSRSGCLMSYTRLSSFVNTYTFGDVQINTLNYVSSKILLLSKVGRFMCLRSYKVIIKLNRHCNVYITVIGIYMVVPIIIEFIIFEARRAVIYLMCYGFFQLLMWRL